MLQREGVLAALAAEVERLALVLERGRARHDRHRHPAHGIDRGRRRLLRRPPHGDDLGQDRERDLLRRARADVEAGGRVDAVEQLGRRRRRRAARRARPGRAAGSPRARRRAARPRAPPSARAAPRGRGRRRPARGRPSRGSNSPPTTATMSSPNSPPSRSSACEIGMSPSTSTRGAGTTGSTNTSIIPPDRHGFCTVTTPRSSSPPNGTTRSRIVSPPSIARSAYSRTLCSAQSPPTKPSIVPSSSTSAVLPGFALVGRSTRTTVAVANGTPRSASSCARRVRAVGIIAAALGAPASPPTRGPGCRACRGGRRRAAAARRSPR